MTRRALAAVVALLAGMAVVFSPARADSAPAACDWSAEYTGTLARLGEDLSLWRVEVLAEVEVDGKTVRPWGTGGEHGATVSPVVPCDKVGDVIRHEHMHLQQVRVYGSWAAADRATFGGDRLEIVADCASMLAGSRYTPYVTLAGGCSARDITDARRLLVGQRTTEAAR